MPTCEELLDDCQDARDDARNHAQAESSFEENGNGLTYDKGARGYASDAEANRDEAASLAGILANANAYDAYDTVGDAPASTGASDRIFVRVGTTAEPPGVYSGDGSGGWAMEGAAFATLGEDNRLAELRAPYYDGVRVNGTAKSTSQSDLMTLLGKVGAGETLELTPDATYTLTVPMDLTGLLAPGARVDFRGAKIVMQGSPEMTPASGVWGPTIFVGSSGVQLRNMVGIGYRQDSGVGDVGWNGSDADNDTFLFVGRRDPTYGPVVAVEDVIIQGVKADGFVYGVRLENCTRGHISDVRGTGFFTGDPILAHYNGGNPTRFFNKSAMVWVEGGSDTTVERVTTTNYGQGVLVAYSSENVTVRTVRCGRMFDNGVYISSGDDTLVEDVRIDVTPSSAVKVRTLAKGRGTIRTVRAGLARVIASGSPVDKDGGGDVLITDIRGNYFGEGIKIDRYQVSPNLPSYLDHATVRDARLTRRYEDTSGTPLDPGVASNGVYGVHASCGDAVASRKTRLVLDKVEVEIDASTTDHVGILATYPREGSVLVDTNVEGASGNAIMGIRLNHGAGVQIIRPRADKVKFAVRLQDTVDTWILDARYEGLDMTFPVYETGIADGTRIAGGALPTPPNLIGADSVHYASAHASRIGATEDGAGVRVGHNTWYSALKHPNEAGSSLPKRRFYREGDFVVLRNFVAPGQTTFAFCYRDGYPYPHGSWSSGTNYAIGAQVLHDGDTWRALLDSGPAVPNVGAQDPTTPDTTYWVSLGDGCLWFKWGSAETVQAASVALLPTAGASTVAELEAKINALIASLETARVMAS